MNEEARKFILRIKRLRGIVDKVAPASVPSIKVTDKIYIMNSIEKEVKEKMGQFGVGVIKSRAELESYFHIVVKNGEVALDTETSGLDRHKDKLLGFSLYTEGEKAVYVPLGHINYLTGEPITTFDLSYIKRFFVGLIKSNVKFILFNAKFDIGFLLVKLGVKIPVAWDGYIAGRILNENEGIEGGAGLKALYKKYINNKLDEWDFSSLFSNVDFAEVPIETAGTYASIDAKMTYELYKFQNKYLGVGRKGFEGLDYIYNNVELPLIEVVLGMEERGVTFCWERQKELLEKYENKKQDLLVGLNKIIDGLAVEIEEWNKQAEKPLPTPFNFNSPAQLSSLLYEVLGVKQGKDGTSTGIDSLNRIIGLRGTRKEAKELCKLLSDYRGIEKIITTYLVALAEKVEELNGEHKIYANFNQIGADTGRMSSNNPNLQNIPSRGEGKEIRGLFKATKGNVLISADFSGQEPRLLAHITRDAKMINAFKVGKDLYSEIASVITEKSYQECTETDGGKEGKERRSIAKAIVLGICYGKGTKAIAEDLGISKEKAELIYNKVLDEFAGLRLLMKQAKESAETKGFVETNWGRKRRLPVLLKPDFEVTATNGGKGAKLDMVANKYIAELRGMWKPEEREQVIQRAFKEGIIIKDNRWQKSQADRQTVNSVIQGSAADLTKLAMLKVEGDERLKELGYKMLFPVHDEIVGECPFDNVEQVKVYLEEDMRTAGGDLLVDMKVDFDVSEYWG